jgi:poly(A) polymerase
MPIITPAYPSMCATHNVTASTQMIMTEEFRKGGMPLILGVSGVFILVAASEVVERVIVGTAEWSELFRKHDFFHKYKYYLMIVASAASPELQSRWCVP